MVSNQAVEQRMKAVGEALLTFKQDQKPTGKAKFQESARELAIAIRGMVDETWGKERIIGEYWGGRADPWFTPQEKFVPGK